MKRFLLFVCFVALCLSTVQARQQQSMRFRGSDGWGLGTRYEQLFDNFNLTTATGTVIRMDTATPMRDMGVAVRLIVSVDRQEIPIHLGPMWYALNQDVNFPVGETIEIRGCRTQYSGNEFFMPVEIRARDRIFRFRDEDGNPFWSINRPRNR